MFSIFPCLSLIINLNLFRSFSSKNKGNSFRNKCVQIIWKLMDTQMHGRMKQLKHHVIHKLKNHRINWVCTSFYRKELFFCSLNEKIFLHTYKSTISERANISSNTLFAAFQYDFLILCVYVCSFFTFSLFSTNKFYGISLFSYSVSYLDSTYFAYTTCVYCVKERIFFYLQYSAIRE